jgi:hypothetical protein
MSRPPLDRAPRGKLFIGWAAPSDPVRRGMVLAGLGLVAGSAGAGAIVGAMQLAPGSGGWSPAQIRTWTGRLVLNPYPTLIWKDAQGGDQAALLGCPDKVEAFAGKMVTLRGSLIQRGGLRMIAAADEPDWIRPAPNQSGLSPPVETALGAITLEGELMDAKCWLGAMRPGEGLTHKSCAILCVRMGLPLLFVAGPPGGRRRAFVATDATGATLGEAVLSFVADPVRVTGQAMAWGGWPRLRLTDGGVSRL